MKGMGIIILVVAGIAAAFYFLKGKVRRGGVEEVTREKRHTPVYKEKAAKSPQEIHKPKVKTKSLTASEMRAIVAKMAAARR